MAVNVSPVFLIICKFCMLICWAEKHDGLPLNSGSLPGIKSSSSELPFRGMKSAPVYLAEMFTSKKPPLRYAHPAASTEPVSHVSRIRTKTVYTSPVRSVTKMTKWKESVTVVSPTPFLMSVTVQPRATLLSPNQHLPSAGSKIEEIPVLEHSYANEPRNPDLVSFAPSEAPFHLGTVALLNVDIKINNNLDDGDGMASTSTIHSTKRKSGSHQEVAKARKWLNGTHSIVYVTSAMHAVSVPEPSIVTKDPTVSIADRTLLGNSSKSSTSLSSSSTTNFLAPTKIASVGPSTTSIKPTIVSKDTGKKSTGLNGSTAILPGTLQRKRANEVAAGIFVNPEVRATVASARRNETDIIDITDAYPLMNGSESADERHDIARTNTASRDEDVIDGMSQNYLSEPRGTQSYSSSTEYDVAQSKTEFAKDDLQAEESTTLTSFKWIEEDHSVQINLNAGHTAATESLFSEDEADGLLVSKNYVPSSTPSAKLPLGDKLILDDQHADSKHTDTATWTGSRRKVEGSGLPIDDGIEYADLSGSGSPDAESQLSYFERKTAVAQRQTDLDESSDRVVPAASTGPNHSGSSTSPPSLPVSGVEWRFAPTISADKRLDNTTSTSSRTLNTNDVSQLTSNRFANNHRTANESSSVVAATPIMNELASLSSAGISHSEASSPWPAMVATPLLLLALVCAVVYWRLSRRHRHRKLNISGGEGGGGERGLSPWVRPAHPSTMGSSEAFQPDESLCPPPPSYREHLGIGAHNAAAVSLELEESASSRTQSDKADDSRTDSQCSHNTSTTDVPPGST